MTNAEYFMVATDVFLPPDKLVPMTTIVTGTMGLQIAEMGQLHTTATRIYCTYHNMDQAFKRMFINAIEDQYLNALSDEIVGCVNGTSLQLLSHLLTYYTMIASPELTQNYERLNTTYDPNQPIKNLFQQVQDDQAFAMAGGQPYGDVMIVNVAFTLVFNTGLFPDACCAWQARAIADKTWMQFKPYFLVAYRECCLTNQTDQQYGSHSANMMIEQGCRDTMQGTVYAIAQRQRQRQRQRIAER
jgi:hypothetical protein